MLDRSSIENSGANRDSVQPRAQTSEFYSIKPNQPNQSIFQSNLPGPAPVDPEPVRRTHPATVPLQPSSADEDGEELEAEVDPRSQQFAAQNFEDLKAKDRKITQLQEEKRRLETELGEWRSKMIPTKVIEKPTAQAKAFEAWQIAGVLILAVFLGYFLGTK